MAAMAARAIQACRLQCLGRNRHALYWRKRIKPLGRIVETAVVRSRLHLQTTPLNRDWYG